MSILLVVLGISLVAAPLAAELWGIGAPGFGIPQIVVTLCGSVLVTLGLARHFGWATFLGTATPWSPGRIVWMGLAVGLVTGLGEDVLLAVRQWGLDRGLSFNPHWFWMKPLADGAICAALGAALAVASRVWPRAGSPGGVGFVLGTVASYALLFMVPGLTNTPALLLSIGLGVQAGRCAPGLERFLHRTQRWWLAAVLALPLGVYAWKAVPEHLARAAVAEAEAGAPNMLLIVLDTVRAESTSLHGYERPTTPRLEGLARQGVRFERAIATSPWTLPSHASMFTGAMGHALFAPNDTPLTAMVALPDGTPTLAERLAARGYDTAGFVANLSYCSWGHGLDRGFAHYQDYPATWEWFGESTSLGQIAGFIYRKRIRDMRPVGRKSADDINLAFFSWLDDRPGDRDQPFFGFLNYFDAHDPHMPPAPFARTLGSEAPLNPYPLPRVPSPPAELARLRDAYDECIAYLDDRIGRLLDGLRDRGVLNDTLIVITSDHGEQFGEHGFEGHANTLYRPLLHVPLVVCWPGGVPASRTVTEPVSLRDLPATILDLLDAPADPSLEGSSLAPLWGHPGASRPSPILAELLVGDTVPPTWLPHWPGAEAGMQSLIAEDLQYISSWSGGERREQLFDFVRDPAQARDLAEDPDHEAALLRLRAATDAAFAPAK